MPRPFVQQVDDAGHAAVRWLEVLPEAYPVQVLTDDAGPPAEEAQALIGKRPFGAHAGGL